MVLPPHLAQAMVTDQKLTQPTPSVARTRALHKHTVLTGFEAKVSDHKTDTWPTSPLPSRGPHVGRLLWCSGGSNSTLCEFVRRHVRCLSTKEAASNTGLVQNGRNSQTHRQYRMQPRGVPNSPFQGLSEYSPPTPPPCHSRRSKGERPIGAATGQQSQPPRPLCHPPPPPQTGHAAVTKEATMAPTPENAACWRTRYRPRAIWPHDPGLRGGIVGGNPSGSITPGPVRASSFLHPPSPQSGGNSSLSRLAAGQTTGAGWAQRLNPHAASVLPLVPTLAVLWPPVGHSLWSPVGHSFCGEAASDQARAVAAAEVAN